MAESFVVGDLTVTVIPTASAFDVVVADKDGLRARVSLFGAPGSGLGIVAFDASMHRVANLTLRRGPTGGIGPELPQI